MSAKIVSYDVIQSDELQTLIEVVRREITGGWQPIGELVIQDIDGKTFYHQTMIYKTRRKR